MRKELSIVDIVWFAAAIVVFIGAIFGGELLFRMVPHRGQGLGLLVFRLIVVDGLGSFIALFLSMSLMGRRYNIIAGTLIMAIFLVYQLTDDLIYFQPDIHELVRVAIMSFSAVGMCLAILAWFELNSKMKKEAPAPLPVTNTEMPKSSMTLILLSLASVPATYVMLFISALVTLGLTLFLMALLLELPRIPVFLIAAAIFAPCLSLWATFSAWKAIFFTKPAFQPAIAIDAKSKPKLFEIILEICQKVKTAPPDVVLLHAEPVFFVQNGQAKTLKGMVRKRILAMGAPLLAQLSSGELKAILAHEFAHFSGKDTLYSRFVMPVYVSLGTAIKEMTVQGDGGWIITMRVLLFVPNLFLRIFLSYFAILDNILSRSRELRADWIAASNYGNQNMESALTKVVQISRHYQENMEQLGYKNGNIFEKYSRLAAKDAKQLEKYKREAMARVEEEMDTHPVLATRIASLPVSAYKDRTNSMPVLLKELNQDMQQLSDAFQEFLAKNQVFLKTSKQIEESFGMLGNAQSMLFPKIIDEVKKKIDVDREGEGGFVFSFLGREVPDICKTKVEIIIKHLKQNPGLYALFLEGVACRIDLLTQCKMEEEAGIIRNICSRTDVEYSRDWKEMPDLQEYLAKVKAFCGPAAKA